MALNIAPLLQGFGARVEGFDAAADSAPETIAALRAVYDTYHLLVFSGCGALSPQRQVEIVGWFGPVGANRDADGNPWTVLDNSEPTGSLILPFHSDICFVPHPLEGLSLHPLALPEVETSTTFISNAVGWDCLPAAVQDHLRSRTVEHRYDAPPEMQLDWPPLAARHPACMRHPRTGREFSFICENYVTAIDDLSAVDSDAMLQTIFDTLYASERHYVHVWVLGDLLVWDNLAIQHARTVPSPPSTGRRILQRVAIGRHNFPDQLEDARATQAV
jgi:taurine dioxygenase